MASLLAELIGTMLLIILGDGVVANVVLKKTKGNSSGWIVITTGWALAVAIPAAIFTSVSGALFNPALTIALAIVGQFTWSQVIPYIIAQLLGAFLGAVVVYITYYNHFEETEDQNSKLGVFCTIPEIEDHKINFLTEFIGTFVLTFAVLGIGAQNIDYGVKVIIVGCLIWAIGLSLGGPTGYAINPARDFGPRLAHFLLPIPGKGSSKWEYAWIPIVAPIIGAICGALVYVNIF
ncbi:aquaporin family protein [Clostridium perfringens]|uniref:Aquaporin family protein n=1 Tax=Clostridium perfringens TaxID=1502 RepID=A0AB37C9S4_CLOPF|nr:MIP/aquaporin family protein [Clostridium perfringens]ASY51227.1 aquaporin [Clostridium perfringens]AWS25728.1 aquaporin family protein [Clostridium perfringens]EDT28332.1 putative glycerol uptake facilitator protein [Clostridium perfringens CPE str. F4969]EGT0679262.1 aquaporin family protein [Clostridium perfringens]MCO6001951.1 aquaporin family protein [Clostridium perfringens]